MPKRSRTPDPDENRAAFDAVDRLTAINENMAGVEPMVRKVLKELGEGKDPAAVALGRRGGLKGGKARAAALTPEQRAAIAKAAAEARWKKKD